MRPAAVAMLGVGAAAVLLYGWFASVYVAQALPGDAAFGQAMEALTALLLLWIALVVLLVIDRAAGGASWTRRIGYLVVPVAAIANTFATDYPSDRLCQAAVLGIPLLTGAYVLLGRLPKRQAAIAQGAALAAMAALSAYAIDRFLS
jgi:hypothetical protein